MKQNMVRLIGSILMWMACIAGVYLLFVDITSSAALPVIYYALGAGIIGTVLRYYDRWKTLVFYLMVIIAIAGVFLTMHNGVSQNLQWVILLIVAALLMFRPEQPKREVLPMQSGKSLKESRTVYMNMEGRRYSLMIEQMWMERMLHVKGTLHGLLKQGDVVMVLCDGMKEQKAIVASVIKNGKELREAADTTVELVLARLVKTPQQFGVISSVVPGELPSSAKENPLLSGLMYEYGRFYQNENYRSVFFHVLEHSRFIVPISLEQTNAGPYTGMKIAFKGISRADNTAVRSFALFTDNSSLERWKVLFADGKAPMTMSITFHDACQIMYHGHNGIVVNPFGPKFVFLSDEMVSRLTEDPSYRKEFGDPHTGKMSFERKGKKKR
jgi:hypothetical protein